MRRDVQDFHALRKQKGQLALAWLGVEASKGTYKSCTSELNSPFLNASVRDVNSINGCLN